MIFLTANVKIVGRISIHADTLQPDIRWPHSSTVLNGNKFGFNALRRLSAFDKGGILRVQYMDGKEQRQSSQHIVTYHTVLCQYIRCHLSGCCSKVREGDCIVKLEIADGHKNAG